MAEELVLTDPIHPPTPVSTTKYRVSSFTMDLETVILGNPLPAVPPAVTPPPEPGLVTVKLKDDAGNFTFYQYTGKLATNMIKQLNTANLSTKSMQKRILEKLSADGFIPGTVTGTPEAPSVLDDDLE